MILLQTNSVRNFFFYRLVNTKPNVVSFLIFVGAAASFPAKSFLSNNYCRETRSHFESRPKTVNIQGYSELR